MALTVHPHPADQPWPTEWVLEWFNGDRTMVHSSETVLDRLLWLAQQGFPMGIFDKGGNSLASRVLDVWSEATAVDIPLPIDTWWSWVNYGVPLTAVNRHGNTVMHHLADLYAQTPDHAMRLQDSCLDLLEGLILRGVPVPTNLEDHLRNRLLEHQRNTTWALDTERDARGQPMKPLLSEDSLEYMWAWQDRQKQALERHHLGDSWSNLELEANGSQVLHNRPRF